MRCYCRTKWNREIYFLIKSIVGQIPFIEGSSFWDQYRVGYYDQIKLAVPNSVLDELWNDFKLTPEVEIRNRLGAFLFWGWCQENCRHTVGWRASPRLAKLSITISWFSTSRPTTWTSCKEVLENALIDFDGTLLLSATTILYQSDLFKVFRVIREGSTLYLGIMTIIWRKKAELEANCSTSRERSFACFWGGSHQLNDYLTGKTRKGTPEIPPVALSNWKQRWKSWTENQDITKQNHIITMQPT